MQKSILISHLKPILIHLVWIKNRLNLVSSNILFGLILVFLALFLSVNYRIAFVVAIGIPASFMITIIGADLMGYSLNMLTLLGALIALGMIVDEAIVVGENIYRHIEMGKSPRDAAIEGAVEMFPAVLTATLTTVFAFLPLLDHEWRDGCLYESTACNDQYLIGQFIF